MEMDVLTVRLKDQADAAAIRQRFTLDD